MSNRLTNFVKKRYTKNIKGFVEARNPEREFWGWILSSCRPDSRFEAPSGRTCEAKPNQKKLNWVRSLTTPHRFLHQGARKQWSEWQRKKVAWEMEDKRREIPNPKTTKTCKKQTKSTAQSIVRNKLKNKEEVVMNKSSKTRGGALI